MSTEWTVTRTRMMEGVWEGVIATSLRGVSTPPIEVRYLNEPVAGVTIEENREQGFWVLRVPVPRAAVCDGVQSFVIRNTETDEVLESFAILAGESLADDLRAEVTLLREELDMLKRAFRRHCLETM